MRSAWGVDDGLVAKSLIGRSTEGFPVFERATKAGAKKLRAVHAASRNGKRSIYTPTSDATNIKVRENMREVRGVLGTLTGRNLSMKPTSAGEKVPTLIGMYPNAHPVPWGQRGQGAFLVGGKKALGDKRIVAHEMLHADKSSWRTAQINVDPLKRAREEARADTLSGTHKQLRLSPIMNSHTQFNRSAARKLPRAEAQLRRAPASAAAQGNHQQASSARAFVDVQDKMDASGRYGTKRAYRRNKAIRTGLYGGTAGAAAGGIAVHEYTTLTGKKVKGYKRKVSKSSPDGADMHVMGNLQPPKRKGRLRRKK